MRNVSARRYYIPPWRVELTERAGVPRLVPGAALARVVARALVAAGAPGPAAVGVLLTDDRELARLNERTMGESAPTDVLSFPLLPVGAFPDHPGQDPAVRTTPAVATAFVLPPGKRVHLGEMAISVERAVAQAEWGWGGQTGDVRWSPADELRLLATHGTLHLCGWDHADPDEEAAMRKVEREILSGE